jgi:hypothetical protein
MTSYCGLANAPDRAFADANAAATQGQHIAFALGRRMQTLSRDQAERLKILQLVRAALLLAPIARPEAAADPLTENESVREPA